MIEKNKLIEKGIVMEKVPKSLYKYGNLDIAKEEKILSIEKGEIWLSYAKELNDPFEGRNLYIDVQKMKDVRYTEKHIKAAYEIYSMMQEHMLIGSFANNSDDDNMLMWAHYANSHKGYCLKYKVVNDEFIYPIEYREKRINGTILIDKIYRNHLEQMQQRKHIPWDKETKIQLLLNYLIKDIVWKYEKEFRVIKSFYQDNRDAMDKTLSEMIPYFLNDDTSSQRFNELQEEFDKICKGSPGKNYTENELGMELEEILIGYRCEYMDELIEVAKKRGVKVFRVEPTIHEEKYSLENIEITGSK